MSKLEQRKDRARSLENKDPRGAIDAWLEVLKAQEEESEPNPDLSIFNRVGDLYLKIKEPAQAADYYDQAVDRYAELGFHNNAIAMCNKVLRNAPGRQTTYFKLAKLYAAKGFMAEAKQNFLEYAERMQKAGKIQQAFTALRELADISAESAHLRELLEDHLRMYGAPERRSSAGEGAAPLKAPPADDLAKSGKRKTSTLVFLDVGEPAAPKGTARPHAPPPRTKPAPAPAREPEPEPASDSLLETPEPEPDTSLTIETTSLGEGADSGAGSGMLDGLETIVQFGDVQLDATDVPSVRDEVTADDVAPMPDLEPTVSDEAEVEPERAAPPPRVPPAVPRRPGVTAPATPGAGGRESKRPAPTFRAPAPTEPAKVKPVIPKRPGAGPPPRKTLVEVPPLELEPDFDTAGGPTPPVDDQPLAMDEPPGAPVRFAGTGGGRAAPPPRRRAGAIDLGLDGVVNQGSEPGSLVFADIDATPVTPTLEELEGRVADAPDDPQAHQALGEALIESGDRDRGIEELDHATAGFENHGQLAQAQDLVDEILRLDPNSVRHRQKQVEFAFKSGDKAKLIEAYVELADTLLRGDLPDKARAVYQRVAEHDPGNARAAAALSMIAPVATPLPAESKGKGRAAARATEPRTAPRDAKMTVRDHAGDAAGDFVDLSSLILEEQLPERDTRMKVADEEPTGDEEQDFQGMLQRFRQGIEENIDEGDFQSHYDLGIAFKEMGLLDEAIAELQKALRASEGRLKSSEALGVCFLEKHAYVVAESILRRALELPASGDQERLGILYWLGRALEEQGKKVEARELYGRVFAVDIRFRDVGARAKALAKAK